MDKEEKAPDAKTMMIRSLDKRPVRIAFNDKGLAASINAVLHIVDGPASGETATLELACGAKLTNIAYKRLEIQTDGVKVRLVVDLW